MTEIADWTMDLDDVPRGDSKKQQSRAGELPLRAPRGMATGESSRSPGSVLGLSMAAAPGPSEAKDAQEEGGERASEPHAPERTPQPPAPASTRGLWVAVFVLAFALIGLGWYGELALRRNDLSLSRLPGILRLTGGLNGRMDAAEAKLHELAAGWGSAQDRLAQLGDHVAELDRKVSTSLQAARKQTRELVGEAEARIEAEMGRRDQAMNARLSQLEATQQDESARFAQLQKEFSNARQETTASQQDTRRDLAGLREQVDQSRSELSTLNQKLARQKVSFEAAKDATKELVPGISLTVTKTDVSYQRFGGYLSLANDGRTLWLPDVGAQQSVVFFPKQSSHPYDLVLTNVNRNGVVGYLLLPAGGSQGEGATAQVERDSFAAAPGM